MGILAGIALFVFLILAVISSFLRTKKRNTAEINESNWYIQISLSRQDALSQIFLLLGGLAAANAIFTVNNELGGLVSWRFILMVAVMIFFAIAYYWKSVYSAILATVGLLFWWCAQVTYWQIGSKNFFEEVAAIPLGLMWLALALYAVGFIQMSFSAWKRFGLAYLLIGVFLANWILFSYSTQYGLESLESMAVGPLQNILALTVVGGAATIVVLYAWSRKILLNAELIGIEIIFLLFGSFVVAASGRELVSGDMLWPEGILWAVIMNFILFAEILGTILIGYVRRELLLVNLGAVLMIFFVGIKYFDWFFKFFDKSIFFIFAGILLFSVGWAMEKGRKYLARAMKEQTIKQ